MTLRSSVVEPIKRHLHDRLPKMCDADPDALSSYILALLQRDQPMDALRNSCSTELEEFLGHQTSHFVNGLFGLIADLTNEGSSSSSHRKRHHDGGSSSRDRSSVYTPYDKRHRHDDRYRHHDHHRRSSSDGYRVDEDYGRTLLDVPPPASSSSSRHYDERRMSGISRQQQQQQQQHPSYNEYRSPAVPSSSPYMQQRIRPPSPNADQMSQRRSSSRWPSNSPVAQSANETTPQSAHSVQQPPPHLEKKDRSQNDRPVNDRSQNDRHQNERPQHQQRSPTNLMIANVPRDVNNLASLSAHFSRFGEIVNIQIKASANRAFIQYRTHDQAKKALGCPEAVCNNRFIKVLWARYDPMDKDSKLTVDGDGAPSILDDQILLLRQQEKEAQIRRDRLQLSSDINSKNTLLAKLKSMTGENAARQAQIEKLDNEISQLQQKLESLPAVPDVAAPVESADTTAAASIQEQLAQAEKEAAAIGIVDEFGNIIGGKYGRGGSVRGKRGRGGGRNGRGEGRRMSLDNRPKTLLVRGIPEQYLNEKMIRSHFQSFGELGRVVMGAMNEPTSALVEYKSRNMAQMALSQGQIMLKQQLQLEWYEGQIDDVSSGVVSQAPSHPESSNNVHDGISDDDEDEDVDRSWKR